MEYAIQVIGNVVDAYDWKFSNFGEAADAAKDLSEKHKVEVMVYKIIGSFKPTVCDAER